LKGCGEEGSNRVLIATLLPTAEAVLGLSREQLGGYILENLNAGAAAYYHGEDNYIENQRNYMSGAQEAYKNNDVTDKFNSAWRWLIEQDHLAEDPRQMNSGWYRLTAKGRTVKRHDQIEAPRVPRDINPGPAPDFLPMISDRGLAKQMHVLWEEAVLSYNASAHLATVVMLGSLLEGALLGKVLDNRADAHRANAAPKDQQGTVRPLDKWRLNDFILVATECQWIHETRIDFVDVLRDYRNLVHPFKAKDGYHIDKGTATICWQVVTEALRDLGVKVG
jgi:hypothetical protein